MLKYFYFIFFLLVLFNNAISQEIGKPFIRNIEPKEYKSTPQNWAIIQDKRGLIYSGNHSKGVFEYDGNEWRQVTENSEQNTVRSFAIDSSGKIYVGVLSDFGFLIPNTKGKLHFCSLAKTLKETDRNFTDIFKTYATKEGVFFQSYQSLILWKNGSYKIWYPKENTSFHLSFYVNGVLYIKERGTGLLKLENNKLVPISGGDIFNEERIYSMLPFESGKILIGTQKAGIYIYDIIANTFTKDIRFKEIEDFIIQNSLYSGIKGENGNYVYATFNGGVINFSKEGIILRVINKKAGLQDDFILNTFFDSDQNLWMGLNNGIAKAEISSPLSIWNETSGLKGGVQSIVRFEKEIYAATDFGVSYLKNGSFLPVTGLNSQCWFLQLVTIPGVKKTILLAGTGTGIYEISDYNAKLINQYSTYSLHQSQKNSSRVFIGLFDGIASIIYKNGQWIDEGRISKSFKLGEKERKVNDPIFSITEDKDGELWLGTEFNGVYRIHFQTDEKFSNINSPQITQYDTTMYQTTEDMTDYLYLKSHIYNNHLMVSTKGGLYYFDKAKEKFHPTEITKNNKSVGVYIVATDSLKNLILCKYSGEKQWLEYFKKNNNAFDADTLTFKRIKGASFLCLYPENDGVIWIGTNNGILRFDRNKVKDCKSDYSAIIRKVSLARDSVLFWGTYYTESKQGDSTIREISNVQSEKLMPVIDYKHNSISFYFAFPGYEDETANLFSYFLEGYDENWSEWIKDNKKDFTNLNEGKYVFHIKAKSIYGIESKEATYSFEILSPWYRTWWAYLFYVVVFIFSVWGIVNFNTYRLKKEKEHLEAVVKERTAEVVLQKEEISGQRDQLIGLNHELHQQKEEIEAQRDEIGAQRDEIQIQKHLVDEINKEVMDSIRYATRIQTSILPDLSTLKNYITDYFMLFRPKDKVSGDFYWSAYVEGHTIIAVADCTGHGVPGAFMSMLGISFLREIVVKEYITNPSIILRKLRKEIIHALKQKGESGEQKDGMDMTLISINQETLEMQFAGANNPCWIIRGTDLSDSGITPEMEELRPDKMPIAIYEKMDPFTNQIIQLQKGDLIYLMTDGYEDQFGGPKNKKFKSKNLRELLVANAKLPMTQQHEILIKAFDDWKTGYEQIDDVSLMGLQI